ncbi:hypothetical protein EV421DRAFT_1060318 [Armillaria borealis]|uniref:Uncharacterized protein n=1 Tax=Armillaria borealis TaxID=47425 RepID=A0AA39MYL9_9AGAR|nr:hypothetical protein EV421DRAFT_1060318 [Armillaria borealis]
MTRPTLIQDELQPGYQHNTITRYRRTVPVIITAYRMERSIKALMPVRRSRCLTASLHQYFCPKLKPERDTNQLTTSPEDIAEQVDVPFVRARYSIRKLQLSCPCQARRVRSMNRAVDALVQVLRTRPRGLPLPILHLYVHDMDVPVTSVSSHNKRFIRQISNSDFCVVHKSTVSKLFHHARRKARILFPRLPMTVWESRVLSRTLSSCVDSGRNMVSYSSYNI